MGSLFKPPQAPKMSMPKPSVPAIPKTEDPGDVESLMKKRSGRARTVLAGDLEPTDIGKRTLLG